MRINKKGFTLMELLVVVMIIGILSSIALPQYFKSVEKARAAEALLLAAAVSGAEQRYFVSNREFTSDLEELDIDVEGIADSQVVTTNFIVNVDTADGVVFAKRNGGRFDGYQLTKDIRSGEIICEEGAKPICASLGFGVDIGDGMKVSQKEANVIAKKMAVKKQKAEAEAKKLEEEAVKAEALEMELLKAEAEAKKAEEQKAASGDTGSSEMKASSAEYK